MNPSQLKLRRKLLLLLLTAGGVGLLAFVSILAITDYQLSERFIPENRSLRDVESRSALLLQNYYRFMLSPEIISVDQLDGELILIRQGLSTYTRLIAGQAHKQQLAASIGNSVDELEQAGREMIASRGSLNGIFGRQEQLEEEIAQFFEQYKFAVSADIGNAIEDQDWQVLTREHLPELRLIDRVRQQFLLLFLNIRKFQIDPAGDAIIDIGLLQGDMAAFSTMLEIQVPKQGQRARLAAQILAIYREMLAVVDAFTLSSQQAGFAVSRAEQSGIDLNQSIMTAITASDTVGWKNLRESLVLSGSILLVTLVISYLLIYLGLDRILSPLEKLQKAISRLGKGDFTQRSRDFGRTDEIGQLGIAFNQMADQLEENAAQKQRFIEQLEQKNMELERFTYTISHELKSPLVTVNGFLGLLEHDLGDNKSAAVRQDMQQIESAIDTMSTQLADLLELARVGRVVNPPQVFLLADLCHDVIDTMQGSITETDAQVVIEEGMPQVYADQVRVREVIHNLLENAIKFSATLGQPRVEVTAQIVTDKVLCRVGDNGPGIDPQYHDRVFELFDRLDSEIPGTGIGLALAKRIIEIHGGKIWIEAKEDGQGCCFCFTLPFQRGTEI